MAYEQRALAAPLVSGLNQHGVDLANSSGVDRSYIVRSLQTALVTSGKAEKTSLPTYGRKRMLSRCDEAS